MATELKERDGKERERRRERDGREKDNDDSRSHRSHRSHREREDHDDDGPHRSRRNSHRSRDDADRDRRRHHSHSPPRERRHSTASRARDTEHEHESHSRESKRHSSSGDHKDDVKAPAYPPDFLRQYSPAGSIGGNDKFDVITGAEAVRFTKQFIRDQAAEGTTLPPALAAALPSTTPPSAPLPLIAKSPSATSHKSLTAHNALESRGSKRLHPVVFALPRSATNAAGGAGRKVVDFYMSWRGKTKTHPLKGPSRRANFLDTEFRRVRETLDGEWKRAASRYMGRGEMDAVERGRWVLRTGRRSERARAKACAWPRREDAVDTRGGGRWAMSSAGDRAQRRRPAGREVIVDTRGGALSRRPRALEAAVRRPSLALPSFFTLHLYLYLSLLTNRTLGVVYGSSPGEAQHRFFSYS
ncbi:hypothetical protein C8F04DRAFT_1406124 [Mycena alexandri]|uniref:Uncharacterized protein n=1 Tax=Mycena alexandri TaxID=1745969 RepID=A0AAD6WLR5_9AGAR|nr:hypothetical protein C8F04DRAFT_1406124 [Mycena alexandri]